MRKINTIVKKSDITKLKSYYGEALGNKDFKEYVDNLDISSDILIKYTSSIEDCVIENNNCKNCPGLKNCPNTLKGHVYTAIEDGNNLNFSYIPCDKLIKEENTYAYKKNITCFDLPKEISEASFSKAYRDDNKRLPIFKYFKEFMDSYLKDKKGKGLYLSGSFGSGKTYLVAALFNELAKKNISSALVYYPELLRSLKSSFGSDYEEKFDFIKTVPILLLDDIGAENTTSWSRDEVLGPILQYRMEEELPTFFTSNLTLNELENALSTTNNGTEKVKAKRIIERIKQLTVPLELISKNRRN
ncbi:MAG TPA: primosomal protein DnaI [Candidatus Onthousia faecipullorum]|uniref:Primosomal protein DnaI n=1 Tax=Candidatus Onthousia faecipullorum TaxID=2840887 RepID=A0A9D1KB77_9FIRM|nr:primosomal protein DnaI [Candidatus Onthousia faecipullorum]